MVKTVWHLCSNRWNSAVTEYAISSARSLATQGWQSLVTGLEGKAFHERSSKYQLPCFPVSGFGLKNLPKLLSLYRQIRPDVVMVYGGPETFISKFLRSSAVVRFRGLDKDFTTPQKPFSYRLSQSHLAGVVCPSEPMLKKFEHLSANSVSIPLGLDTSTFYYTPSGVKDQRPTLMVLGRLDPVKGHGAFFLWFSMLLRQWPETMPKPFLKVVGEPANIPVEHLRGFAEDVKLVEGRDWQLIDDRVDDLNALLAETHLGVICSQGSEVICRVAEEFLLCGVPLFVSGVGSLEDCLYDKEAGVSYKGLRGDQAVKLLQEVLVKAFTESQQQRQDRATKAKDYFSFQAMGKDLDHFLCQLGPSHLRGLEPSALLTKP